MNKPTEIILANVPLWINGAPVVPATARTGDVFNPATGHVTRRVPFAGAELIDAAVKAATALPRGATRPAARAHCRKSRADAGKPGRTGPTRE